MLIFWLWRCSSPFSFRRWMPSHRGRSECPPRPSSSWSRMRGCSPASPSSWWSPCLPARSTWESERTSCPSPAQPGVLYNWRLRLRERRSALFVQWRSMKGMLYTLWKKGGFFFFWNHLMYELLENKLFFQSFYCVKYLNVTLPQMTCCGPTARCVILSVFFFFKIHVYNCF